jgi:hypothetical protein
MIGLEAPIITCNSLLLASGGGGGGGGGGPFEGSRGSTPDSITAATGGSGVNGGAGGSGSTPSRGAPGMAGSPGLAGNCGCQSPTSPEWRTTRGGVRCKASRCVRRADRVKVGAAERDRSVSAVERAT